MARPPEAESNPEPVVQKNFFIYHHLSSISTIRLCKEGKIDGPHFCKNQVPLILELDQIDLFEEEKIVCCATIGFQVMSDNDSQLVSE